MRVEMTTGHRAAYIQDEVEKVRQAFLNTYEADEGLRTCAMELVDSITGRIEARVHALRTEAEQSGAEPKS